MGTVLLARPYLAGLAQASLPAAFWSIHCTGCSVRPSRSHRLKVSTRVVSTDLTLAGRVVPNGVSAESGRLNTTAYLPAFGQALPSHQRGQFLRRLLHAVLRSDLGVVELLVGLVCVDLARRCLGLDCGGGAGKGAKLGKRIVVVGPDHHQVAVFEAAEGGQLVGDLRDHRHRQRAGGVVMVLTPSVWAYRIQAASGGARAEPVRRLY